MTEVAEQLPPAPPPPGVVLIPAWYLYRRPDGKPEAVAYPLPAAIFPGYELVRTLDAEPDLQGKTLDQAGELVPDLAGAWASVRARRNALLRSCDWVMLADAPVSAPVRQAWEVYRQALRDLPEQGDPFAVDWPTPPGE